MTEVAEAAEVPLPSPTPPLPATLPTPVMLLPVSADVAAVVLAVVELEAVAVARDFADEATVLSAEENICTVGYGCFDSGGIAFMSQRQVREF